jgi:hypothetical protein
MGKARFIVIAFLLGCSPTQHFVGEDEVRAARLQNQFGSRYEFRGEMNLYLRAEHRTLDDPTPEEGQQIFQTFWFKDGAPRTDTPYVYLNVYGRDGKFDFQLHWNPEIGKIDLSRTEHY